MVRTGARIREIVTRPSSRSTKSAGRTQLLPLAATSSTPPSSHFSDLLLAAIRDHIYLLTVYAKGVKDDLTAAERDASRKAVEEIENE